MPIAPPILSPNVDKGVQEYLRRLSENQRKIENDLLLFKNNPSSSIPLSGDNSTKSNSPIILTSPIQSQEQGSQQGLVSSSIAPLQVLGQLPQGQFAYIPVLTSLPVVGDPLTQNGSVVFIESPIGTYTQYTFKAQTEPGSWVIAPSLSASPTIKPCCRVFNNAAISIPNNSITTLSYNNERYDTDNIHDNVTNPNRLTCQTAGKYIITLNLGFAANVTGYRGGYINVSGITVASQVTNAVSATDRTYLTVATEYQMAVGDFADSQAFQNSGGALNLDAVTALTQEFSMALISS